MAVLFNNGNVIEKVTNAVFIIDDFMKNEKYTCNTLRHYIDLTAVINTINFFGHPTTLIIVADEHDPSWLSSYHLALPTCVCNSINDAKEREVGVGGGSTIMIDNNHTTPIKWDDLNIYSTRIIKLGCICVYGKKDITIEDIENVISLDAKLQEFFFHKVNNSNKFKLCETAKAFVDLVECQFIKIIDNLRATKFSQVVHEVLNAIDLFHIIAHYNMDQILHKSICFLYHILTVMGIQYDIKVKLLRYHDCFVFNTL